MLRQNHQRLVSHHYESKFLFRFLRTVGEHFSQGTHGQISNLVLDFTTRHLLV